MLTIACLWTQTCAMDQHFLNDAEHEKHWAKFENLLGRAGKIVKRIMIENNNCSKNNVEEILKDLGFFNTITEVVKNEGLTG